MNREAIPIEPSDEVAEFIARFLDQSRQGERPSLGDITAAHPELAEEIRVLYPVLVLIEDAAETRKGGETLLAVPESEQLVGQSLGRYQIEGQLGRGGMGTVYLAQDTKLHRRVALKIPHFHRQDDTSIARFEREARSMAALHHRNLCPVYDAGEIEGRHFLTMAAIEGSTLKQTLQEDGPLGNPKVVEFAVKIASAIQTAHEAGIVHRDLKPANVMIDPVGEPIVMDFGLAHSRLPDQAELTQTDAIVGSPAYMAPEQIEPDIGEIGPRTDVYALGVILYEMLTGRPPFAGTSLSVMRQVVESNSPQVAEIKPGCDPRLNAICRKAMAKSPSDRYPSIIAMAEELNEALVGLTGLSSDEKLLRTRATLAIRILGVLLLATLCAWGIYELQSPSGPSQKETRDVAEGFPDANPKKPNVGKPARIAPERLFFNSGHNLGTRHSTGVALGDLDQDGDLDAFVTNYLGSNQIWTNDGHAHFDVADVELENGSGVVLGDVDQDGDLDAVVFGTTASVWLNEGSEGFKKGFSFVGMSPTLSGALDDFDEDGDRDLFLVRYGSPDELWWNEGGGQFRLGHQRFGEEFGNVVRLVDWDHDQDIDILVGHSKPEGGVRIWINSSQGHFSERANLKTEFWVHALAVGDVNRDRHPDFVAAAADGKSCLYLNDGTGGVAKSPQVFDDQGAWEMFLADFDGDRDLDLLRATKEGSPLSLYFNDGEGGLGTPILFGPTTSNRSAAVGDLDNDGDQDLFLLSDTANTVWLNRTVEE